MEKMLYIIRGLPGSGKSTFAAKLAAGLGIKHHEADNFFIMANGEYRFDPAFLNHAHHACRAHVEMEMSQGNSVVVSNTFTTEKELKLYHKAAEEYGFKVTHLIVENRHGECSTHDVPEETMVKMKNRFSVKL